MTANGPTAQAMDSAVALLECEPGVCAAYLLGSTAKGTARHDSDVDIALLPARGSRITGEQRLDLAALLGAKLGCPVDLGLLSTANVVYAKEVIVHGRELFSKDAARSQGFLALCLSLYADLQRARKEVLDAYAT